MEIDPPERPTGQPVADPSSDPQPDHGLLNGHVNNSPANGQHTPADGLDALRAVLSLYRDAAVGLKGYFVLTIIDARTNKALPQRFAPRDVDGMAAEAAARAGAANVYFAPAVLKKSLAAGARGGLDDIVVVLGLVIDDDGDTGKRAVLPPITKSSLEITTCWVPFVNRQHHFVFTKPLTVVAASKLAELLHRKCGGDYGTADPDHVWRLPQTRNHPNAKKINERRRPPEPQDVTLTGGSFQRIDPDAFRRELEVMPDLHPPRASSGIARGNYSGGSTDRDEIIARLPGDVNDIVETEVIEGEGDRSAHSFHTTMALIEHGLTDDEIRLVAKGAPFAAKFRDRGDLDEEIGRVRARWEAEGKQLRAQAGTSVDQEKESPDVIKDIKAWPIMESKATHGIVGKIARLATANSEADPVAVIGTAITYGAAEFGRAQFCRIGDTIHHSRHFNALVGKSSRGRKGTSNDPVERIFKRAWEIRKAASTLPFPSGLPLHISPGPLSSGEGLVYAVRDASEPDEEGNIADPGVKDKRLLVVEEELGAALRAFQRTGNNLSMILRRAFDGKTIEPMTKSNRLVATEPHINVLGHITLPELKGLLTGTEVWNGFGNRFQWLMARRTKEVPFPKPMPDEEVEKIATELARVITVAHQRGAAKKGGYELILSNSAQDHWAKVYSELVRDHPGILGAVTSRQEAHARRLAMTYAQFDGAERIEIVHLEAALAFCRYAFDSAVYLFGETELDPIAQKILEALETGPKTQNEIVDLLGRHQPKQRLAGVLTDLQEKGRITMTKEGTGGRPRSVWRLVSV
jgi:hypothetical protein